MLGKHRFIQAISLKPRALLGRIHIKINRAAAFQHGAQLFKGKYSPKMKVLSLFTQEIIFLRKLKHFLKLVAVNFLSLRNVFFFLQCMQVLWSHSGTHSLIFYWKQQYPLFVFNRRRKEQVWWSFWGELSLKSVNSMHTKYFCLLKNVFILIKYKYFGLSQFFLNKLIFHSAGWIQLIQSDSFDIDNVITKCIFYFK